MRRLAGLSMLLAATIAGQVHVEPRPKPAPPKKDAPGPANIRVDTTLILVPVSVNDPLNRPVSGLEKENFRVFDDKVEQSITQFAMDDEPVAVGLVFDTSGSMGDKLQRSRMAAREFFRIANPEDEFFLVEFDDSPKLRVPLTSDTGTIENELIFSKSHGSTALLDAVYLALHEMRKSKKNKKALLIISDGGDNHSRYSTEGSDQPGARKRRVDLCHRRLRRRHHARGSERRRLAQPGSPSRPADACSKPTRWNCRTSPRRSASNCAIATFSDIRPRTRRTTGSTTASRCRWFRRADCRNYPPTGDWVTTRRWSRGWRYAGNWRTRGGKTAFMNSTAVLVAASASPSRTGTTILTSEVSLRW